MTVDLADLVFVWRSAGVAEGDMATQRRKDRYRQDLLEQMAEQQRNKKK